MNISSSIENKIYFSKYKPDLKIGEGSFGKIYSAHNINNGELFALKLEERNNKHSLLESETYILCYLKGEGIPYIKSYGFSGDYNILVMELLGKSLEKLFQENKCKFSLKTVCMLADQMIKRLEYIHKKYFIHRDIKPDNFTIGRGKNSHIIYLIDFGLSKKYKSSKGNNEHIKYSENKKLIGTARYASINALKGCEQGRRDDMESLGYVLLYFLRGNLPWQGLKLYKGDDRYKKIYEVKKNTPIDELCAGFPKEFNEYIKYTRNLNFEQEPNYDYLKKLIYNIMNRYEFNFDFLFDWGLNKNKFKFNKKIINENENKKKEKGSNDVNINKEELNSVDKNKKINKIENNKNIIKNYIKTEIRKKQTKTQFNKNNNNLNTKKTNIKKESKLNKDFTNKDRMKKIQFNNKTSDKQKNTKNIFNNSIKNKKDKIRNKEKTTTKKNYLFKKKDDEIFEKLLNTEPNMKDVSFINKSQNINLRSPKHYKFISELNSTEKKNSEKKNIFPTKKELMPIGLNKKINEDNKDDGCFIF
jgi:serine/threonine protein kinase